jgi:hypothetical protein
MRGVWAQREDETSSGAKRVGKSRAEPGQSRAEQRGKAGRAGTTGRRRKAGEKKEATGNGRVTGTGRVLTSIAGQAGSRFFSRAHGQAGTRWTRAGQAAEVSMASKRAGLCDRAGRSWSGWMVWSGPPSIVWARRRREAVSVLSVQPKAKARVAT